MPEYHPNYGNLMSSKEVASITGYTVNQLRNFRYRPETSPFPFLRQGGTSKYREADIVHWLNTVGGAEMEYVVPPNVVAAPLLNPMDAVNLVHFNEMKQIVTSNAWGSKGTYLIESSGIEDIYQKIDEWAEYYWSLHTGKPSDENGWMPLGKARKGSPHVYWPSITWAVRKAYSELREWGLTDEQIMSADVGEVPPSRLN